jgi:hypothetical protein
MKYKTVILLVGVFFLSMVVSSQSFSVTKSASAADVREGDNLTVYLTVRNDGGDVLSGKMWDYYPVGQDVSGARTLGFDYWAVEFDVSVPSRESRTYNYTIHFGKLPLPWMNKRRTLNRAQLKVGELIVYSNDAYVTYYIESDYPCNFNDVCEPQLRENYQTCYEDCPSGSADGFCDGKHDRLCDQDCDAAGDKDCTPGVSTTLPSEHLERTTTLPSEPLEKKPIWPFYLAVGLAVVLLVYLISRRWRRANET